MQRFFHRASVDALQAACLGIAIVLLVPIGGVVLGLFDGDGIAWAHISRTTLSDLVANSLMLALAVAVGVAVIGTSCAWLTTQFEFPGRSAFEWLLILPLAMPAYVMAYAYTDALQYAGPVQSALREMFAWQTKSDYWFPEIRSLGGAATMLTFVLYPYVYLLARVAFNEQSTPLSEAGRTFGLSRIGIMWRVSLPLARPAIAAGTALAVMETLADFGTVSYFGVNTFTTGIFNAWFSQGDRASASKLAVILLLFVALAMALEHAARRRSKFHQVTGRAPSRHLLAGVKRFGAMSVCGLPILVGFALPTFMLLRLAMSNGDSAFGANFLTLVGNSVAVSMMAAIAAVALALLLAYGARLSRRGWSRAINRATGLGYAIPGTVIAVGVLVPVGRFDHALVDVLEHMSGHAVPLLLTGGVAVLVYAYLIRFLGVAQQSVDAGLANITPSMDDAARSLGASTARVAMRVHAPLLKGSLITAGLLVFVEVMKELPATLVLRPFNFDTLAVQAYHLAMDERLAEASTASLAIVAVGLIPVIAASRAIARATTGSRRQRA